MEITDMLGSLGSGVIGTVTTIIALVVGGVILAGLFYLWQSGKSQEKIRMIIWEHDAHGQIVFKTDEATVHVDKDTNNKRLHLKKGKVGLEPDHIPFMLDSKGNKYVIALKTGLKNYKLIQPDISEDHIRFNVGEEDVNWSLNAFEKAMKRFSNNWLQQYAPFIILAFAGMIMLVMFIQIFNKLPLLLDIAKQNAETARLLTEAVQMLKSGTVVIS